MNQNLFRLVFNAARGLVMAVSEVVPGKGRVARGERRGRKMALAGFAFALSPLAWAQIIADPSAAGGLRPQVVTTASGVTQVNIQTPSAAGVSRNVYRQFDVGSQGAILNNSGSNVQTQIGGWVQGNSNLAAGTARIILNEVNSANPSQLRGYVEVAGKSAEVIIANPAGISVNGGGFINASGVTLTTGTPQLSGGSLDSYRVQGGTIAIEGAGLDANNADFANIMARAVQTNAGIWAKDLRVTTGANTINAANTSATVITGTGATPTVALDVSTLGGMYANKITLVGTEAGLGVNNAGSIVARGGDLVLQSNGVLTNRGLIDAGNTAGSAQTRISATTVNNIGTGAIFGDQLAIEADTLNNQAEIVNGTVYGATIGARTSLNLGVQTLNNTDMGLDTPGNPSLGTSGTTSVNIVSLGDILIGGSLNDAGQAKGTAASVNNTSATIQAVGNMVIDATEVNNTDAHFASTTQTTTSAVSETIGSAAAGYYVNVNQQTVSSPVVTAALPGVLSAGGDLTIRADTVNNANSRMLAGGTVTIPEAAVVTNAGVTGTRITTKTGTAYSLSHDRSCEILVEKGGCVAWGPWYEVWTASGYASAVPETITVGAGTQSNGASTTAPGVPGATVSNSSLYQIDTNPVANYVVVTNPAFTNYKTWLGSDYMLRSVALDPSVTQKRLGDGFYEQRLLNEQIAQLTGRRFLADYTSDDAQYRALMDAGVTYANAFKLRPGIALTAAQVARLTSDIVWLQQEEVTLPDGSKVLALVPQVYLSPRSGDLSPSGGLISGDSLNIAGSSITNSGTLLGRKVVQINADTINNLGGSVRADAVALSATQDINNTAGTVTAQDQLILQAGRDINSTSTVATASTGNARNGISNTVVDRIAGLYVKGDAGTLLASAGRDINLIASQITNSGANSQTTLVAQNDITLSTLNTRQTNNLERDSDNYRRATSTEEAGSSIESAGNVTLSAGNDVNARAASVQSGGNLSATAGNNVTIEAGVTTSSVVSASKTSYSGFLSSSTRTERSSTSSTQAIASEFGGNTVNITVGQEIGVKASNVVADIDLTLTAGGKVTIEAGTNTQTQSSFSASSESGLMSGGGLDVNIGNRDQSTDQKSTRTTAAASTVGSTGGNVTITAGRTYTQTGSDVLASGITSDGTPIPGAGNIDITAKQVDIVEARETSSSETKTKFEQSGITLALSNPVVSAAQTMQRMAAAADNTQSERMKALAAASAALAAKNAAPAAQKLMNGQLSSDDINVSLSVGSSSSESTSTSSSNTARGSSVNAAGNTTIRATGDGANSSLTIQGSTIQSEDTTTLAADNQVQLLAAANTATQTSDQKSSSGSVGVTLGKNTGVTVSASQGSGDGNGQDVDYTNTQVQGGKVVNIQSGGDTTLKGAVAKADAVNVTVGDNLLIESLQDSSRYKESSQNASGSVTLGAGAGGSVSAGATNINSNYLSVTEQSGIKTGDGGFNVQVQGNTDLKGGAMTSTQAAIDNNRNTFTTAKLTTSDLQNSASYSAESYQVSVGTSGGSAGAGQDSGKASSTTTSGISGVAGNKNARTGDQETGIKKIFDADKVSKEVNAQTAITSEFGKQASEAVESYSSAQRKVLQDQLKQAKTPEDKEKAQQAIKDVNTQERALNILVGVVSGLGVSSVTKEGLATAADEMRQLMVEDSKKFAGVVDSTGKVLSNSSGESVGVNGDGVKLGGTRVDLDILCGVDNSRCAIPKNPDGSVDTTKPVIFTGGKNTEGTPKNQTLADFISTPKGQTMSGATGGIQGEKGTLFGVPYAAGSWQDKLIESFAGPHDMIVGKFSGLYDGEGNAERGRSELTTTLQNRWSEVAVLPSAPFAAAQSLPPEVWKAIAILLGAGK